MRDVLLSCNKSLILKQLMCKQVCTMTNGSKEVTQKFLDRSKLDFVSPVLDVEGPRAWKPCRAAYQYVLDQLGLPSEQVADSAHGLILPATNSCHKCTGGHITATLLMNFPEHHSPPLHFDQQILMLWTCPDKRCAAKGRLQPGETALAGAADDACGSAPLGLQWCKGCGAEGSLYCQGGTAVPRLLYGA